MSNEEQQNLLLELEEKLTVRKRKHDRKSYFSVVDYDARFSVGQEISMAFPLPVSQEHIRIAGEVVRVNAEGIGVKFMEVEHEQEALIRRLVDMMH
jgi:Tfp pilus assembly protein PilZ